MGDGFLTIIAIILIVCAMIVINALIKKQSRRTNPRTRYSPPPPSRPAQFTPPGPSPFTSAPSRAKPSSRPPPQNVLLNLDIGSFKPMTDAEVKRASVGLQWGAFAFRLRSQIPPASDPRTGIIDRAMVGQGIITPEELVEIHKTGEQMDAMRPHSAQMAAHVEAAVAKAKVERAQLKEQKKRDAAERKRLHAEACARRKATDIVFLGRGVSKGLADRRTNVEKLQTLGLPILATPSDVATALGLSIPKLRWLAYHSDAAMVSHYIRFTVPKRSGGVRQLAAPHKYLASSQEWILHNILEKIPTHPSANGFARGKSTVTNAIPHVKREVVVNTDLTDFFPTITFPRVAGIFRQLGYSPAAATILALICTESPRREVIYAGDKLHVAAGPRSLPQGACTSPALSNLIARRLDSRLHGIATTLGWEYTRYADDLTFSVSGEASKKIGYLLARIRHITQDEGFSVNEKKTRVQRRHMAQSVTGVIVNDRPSAGRDVVRRIRSILHHARREGLKAQNRENLPHFEAWLHGMIAYISMIDPQKGAKLRDAYAELSPSE